MKALILNIFLCLFTCLASGQTFEWANSYGGGNTDVGYKIASDSKGNNYFTGKFLSDSVIFGSDTLITNFFQSNLIVGKHNSKGKAKWAYAPSFKSGSGSCEGKDIAIKGEHLYITGLYRDTVFFGKQDTLYGVNNASLFLLKMDTTGKVIWTVSNDTTGFTEGLGIDVNNDKVVIGGRKNGRHLVVKYDTSGSLKWEKQSAFTTTDEINDVGLDSTGKVIGTGTFQDSIAFNNDTIYSKGSIDAFFVKFNKNGSLKWLKRIGGANRDFGKALSVAASGEFLATGRFEKNIFYQTDTFQGYNQSKNVFIASFKANGNLKWLRYAGGDASFVTPKDINLNEEFIYVAGDYVKGKPIFGNDTLPVFGSNDIFIAKLNDKGKFLYAFGTGGSGLPDNCRGLSNDKNGNVYFTGQFSKTTSFGNQQISSNGFQDIFVSKLSDIRIYQDTIPDTTLCAGQSLQVPFTVDGDFDPGNTFTAQLSNDTGNFDNPIPIGSIKDTVGDTIMATIPDTLPYGTGYKMRIVSDSPRVVSFDDGQTYTIFPQFTPTIKSASVTQTDTATGQVTVNWKPWPDTAGVAFGRLYGKSPSDTGFRVLKDSIARQDSSYVQDSLNTKTQTYQYYLTTIDSCGFESDSAAIHRTVNLTFKVGQLLHDLSWTPYEGWPVNNYLVQRKQGGTYQTLDSLSADDTTLRKAPQPCNSTINYRIKAIDSNGQFSYSDTAANEALDTINPDRTTLTNVSVIRDSVVRIDFKEADSLDIFAYDVRRQRDSGRFTLAERDLFDSAGGTFTVFDTTNTRTGQLCYSILTQDSCLNTVSSDTFCAIQLEGQPKNQANRLTWKGFKGYPLDSQLLLRKAGSTYDTIATLGRKDSSFVDTPLPCNRAQTYKLKAFEQGGSRTTLSDTIRLTPFDTIAPAAPAIRSLSILGPDSARLRWQLSDSNVTRYELWLKTANTNWQNRDTVGVQTSYTYSGLNTTDSQYCARLVAIDSCAANRSAFSEVHCAVQLKGKAGNLENKLKWKAYQGFSNPDYVIEKKQNGRYQNLATVTDTSFTDTNNISCNVPETYRIQALNSTSPGSAYSDTITLTPFDTIAPPSPQLQFASAQTNGDVQVQWNWQPTTDQKYFEIWRDTGFGNFQRLDTVTYDSTFTDQTARPAAIQHQYYIIATDSCAARNRSAPSDTDRLMVPKATTGACRPENVLSWNAYDDLPQGVDQYEIYRTQQQGTSNPFNLLTTNNEQQTTYLDTNLSDTITYCYRIKAVDTQSGYSAWSDSICKEPFDYPVPDTSEVIRSTVTKTGKTTGAVKVFWQRYPKNDTFARGYEIYQTTGQKPQNFQLINRNSNLSDTTFTHKGINTSDDVHNYRVLIYNLCRDQGGFFNTHQPVNLSATNQNLSIKLDWVPYRGFPVQDYRVQKSIDGGPFRNIATLNGSDTSLVDSNIRCGIDYSYKVFADGTKAQETSVSDTIIRTGFDTIPADRPNLHRAAVTATDNNQGEVELLFKGAPQANRKGYVISRQQGSTFQPLDTILTAQQTNLTYTANKLNTAQTSQTFYIQTIDSCGNISLPSDTHRTIALTATPKNAYVQLKWSAYRDWDDRTYQVQRRQSSAPWQTLTTLDSGQLSDRDSNVTCQEVYQYRIIGKEKGTSDQAWSNTDTAKAFESTPPAPPVIRRASVTRTGTSNGKVNITWNRSTSTDAAKYTIYRSPNGQDYQFLDIVTSTSYTDQGLNTYNQPYHYRLKAIDSCDNLSDSFSTPHRTINLEASGSEEAVILSWNEYKGRTVSQYQILRGQEVLYTVSGEQTFLRDEKVICDTFYNYQVRALMEGDTSIQALSNTDSAKATDNTPPSPIYLQRASVTRFNDVVELKWQASEAYDAKAYQIYRRNENTGDFNQIAQVKHPNTTYKDSFPINNREVCYFVKVKDACGNSSEFSNRGCIIQPEGEALDLENELSWPPYEKWQRGTRTYQVFKQQSESTYKPLARLDSSKRSYLDQDLLDSADQFCYYIRAEGFGEETYSRSTRICLEQSAIVHIPNTFSPGVTPNLNDQFGPEGLYIANYEMQIYNRWGEQVFTTSTSEEWDGTYRGELVPQGVYHYQIVVRSEDGSRETYEGRVTVIR